MLNKITIKMLNMLLIKKKENASKIESDEKYFRVSRCSDY